VEGLFEIEKLVVQVVAELMEEGAQEGAKGHHLCPMGRPHPERDTGKIFVLTRLVETVELPPAVPGPHLQYGYLNWRHLKSLGETVDQLLADSLGFPPVLLLEGGRELSGQGT
jgi:hypothetical protein